MLILKEEDFNDERYYKFGEPLNEQLSVTYDPHHIIWHKLITPFENNLYIQIRLTLDEQLKNML